MLSWISSCRYQSVNPSYSAVCILYAETVDWIFNNVAILVMEIVFPPTLHKQTSHVNAQAFVLD